MLEYGERVLRELIRWHYHIPRFAYVLADAAGSVAVGVLLNGGSSTALAVAAFITVVGLQGLARWAYDRHPLPMVAVPRFAAATHEQAAEVQRLILTSLRDHFPDKRYRFLLVAETVGPDDIDFATRLRLRLRAAYLLCGEVRSLSGHMSVFARLLGPPRTGILHADTFTQDVTPQRTAFRRLFHRLTPTHDPDQTEYPLDFTTEVESLLRSLEAKVLLMLDRPDEAEAVLRRVLQPVANSESHAVDLIRLDLVQALDRQDRDDEALHLLRERAAEAVPSPELLRTLAGRLQFPVADLAQSNEAIDLLQRAAADRTDPERDMSVYNLAQILAHTGYVDKAVPLVDELLRGTSHYRNAWYLKRMKGVQYWEEANEAAAAGRQDEAVRKFRMAGKWYSAAIAARPRYVGRQVRALVALPVIRRGLHVPSRPHFIPVPPVMLANAHDAWVAGERFWRHIWYHTREVRARNRMMNKGRRALRRSDWDAVVRHFGRAVVGRNDGAAVWALVMCAIAEHAMGHHGEEAGRLAHAESIDPEARHLYDELKGVLDRQQG